MEKFKAWAGTQQKGCATDSVFNQLFCFIFFLNRINRIAKPNWTVFDISLASTGEFIGQVLHQMHNDKPGCTKPIENHLHLKKTVMEALKIDAIFCKKKDDDNDTCWMEERISSKAGKNVWSMWAICMWIPDKKEKNNLKENAGLERAEKIVGPLNKHGQSQKFDFPTSCVIAGDMAPDKSEEPAHVADFLITDDTFKVIEMAAKNALKKEALKDKNKHTSTICTRLSSFAQWLGPEEGHKGGLQLPEMSKRDTSQEGLWGQNDTEFAAGGPPHGRHLGQQGRVPEEEPPACSAADTSKGLSVAVNRSSQLRDQSCSSNVAGLLCEGGWLTLLSCWAFSTQSPSASKDTQGFREQARIHMKANGLEWAIAQILASSQQGPCHGPKLPDDKQGSLGIASQPASGRGEELFNLNPVHQ
jgi:hypothetical protein